MNSQLTVRQLTVRWPRFDFGDAEILWPDKPEISLQWNAMSTSAPIVEPFLNKVMTRCRKAIRGDCADLKADVDDFVRQESSHYRMHEAFNRHLAGAGYPIPREMDDAFEGALRTLLKEKSASFLAAYCAGFENYTLFASQYLFEKARDLFREGDGGIGDLWLWHLAEEYEHRTVCHDVFAHISGNYFMRIYGVLYAFIQLNSHNARRVRAFLDIYRATLSAAERRASIRRYRRYQRGFLRFFIPRALTILMPFYDPAKARPSPGVTEALARYGAMSDQAAMPG